MGLLNKIFSKKKETVFDKVEEEVFVLSNQNGKTENPTKEDLKDYLNCLFDEDDQFITLTLSKAKNGVRFIQACFAGTDLVVQLGLEDNDKTHLVEKTCVRSEECVDIFYKFYDYELVDNIENTIPYSFKNKVTINIKSYAIFPSHSFL